MKKEPMSIGTQMFWGKIFVGCTWIGSGVFGIFDNLVCDILHIICLLSAIIVMVVLTRVDLEEDDEMAEYNYTKANAKTTRYMHIVFCVCSVLSAIGVGSIIIVPALGFAQAKNSNNTTNNTTNKNTSKKVKSSNLASSTFTPVNSHTFNDNAYLNTLNQTGITNPVGKA